MTLRLRIIFKMIMLGMSFTSTLSARDSMVFGLELLGIVPSKLFKKFYSVFLAARTLDYGTISHNSATHPCRLPCFFLEDRARLFLPFFPFMFPL